jgi:uncharacterized membrane protein YhiD involved in acid resistance
MFDNLINFLRYDFIDALNNLVPVVVALGVASMMGLLIYYVYGRAFHGVVFNHKFSVTLAVMTVLSAMITLAISSNIALSLGMVGALSIVRYRTAIKDPLDIMYLFWAVGNGIAVGAKQYYLAVLGALAVILMLWSISERKSKSDIYIFLVHYSGKDLDERLREILRKWRYKIKSKTVRQKDTELAIEISVKNNNLAFVDNVKKLPSVKDVTLIQYDGEYHD